MKGKPIKKASILFLFLILYCAVAGASWAWTGFMGIEGNYIHPNTQGSPDRVLVLRMDQAFHSCGWDEVGNINSAVVGDELFNALTGAFLSAWMANKNIALLVDGCDGDRAKIYGIRIDK